MGFIKNFQIYLFVKFPDLFVSRCNVALDDGSGTHFLRQFEYANLFLPILDPLLPQRVVQPVSGSLSRYHNTSAIHHIDYVCAVTGLCALWPLVISSPRCKSVRAVAPYS